MKTNREIFIKVIQLIGTGQPLYLSSLSKIIGYNEQETLWILRGLAIDHWIDHPKISLRNYDVDKKGYQLFYRTRKIAQYDYILNYLLSNKIYKTIAEIDNIHMGISISPDMTLIKNIYSKTYKLYKDYIKFNYKYRREHVSV